MVPPCMRRRVLNNLSRLPAVLAAALLHAWAGTGSGAIKHYGYSGQDKMLACIQQVFGKYAAAWPHTVLYGSPPLDLHNMEIVNGYWEPVTKHITYPPVSDLPCPSTREEILKLLQNDMAKLLWVPQGEPEGIRIF